MYRPDIRLKFVILSLIKKLIVITYRLKKSKVFKFLKYPDS